MKKELQFSAKLDMNDFNRDIDQMQKKLKDMYAQSDVQRGQNMNAATAAKMGIPGVSGTTAQQYQQSTQANARAQEKMIRDGIRLQEQLGKEIQRRWEFERKTNEELVRKNQLTAEDLRLQKQMAEFANNTQRMTENYQQRQKMLSQTPGGPGYKPPGPGGGGGGGAPGGGFFGGGVTKSGVFGALGMIAGGSALIDNYHSLPGQRSVASGNATQSLTGGVWNDTAKGNVLGVSAWMPERQRAAQMATEQLRSRETWGTAGNLLSGSVGAAKNLMGGELTPGQGMGYNQLMATGAGVVGGAFKYGTPGMRAANMLTKGLTGSSISDRMSGISDNYQTAYQSQLMEEYGGNYEKYLAAEKKKNPRKQKAVDYMSERYMGDLGQQRRMGFNDEEMYGNKGFMDRANKGGFTDELAFQMSGAMGSAGGSTRAFRSADTVGLGLKAARGMDMTNAGSVLGQISGGAGSSQATNQVFQKLLESSVRSGLDTSEYREEQRKYAEVQATILGKSGAATGGDAERILAGLQSFMGGSKTMKGIEGATSAYQEAQQFSGETSGRGGALQFAAMMKNPILRKVGPQGMAGLMQIHSNELTTNNPMVIAQAEQAGVSPEALIKEVSQAKREKATSEIGLDPKQTDKLKAYMGDKKVDTLTSEQLHAFSPEMKKAYINLLNKSVNKSGYEGTQKFSGTAQGLLNGSEGQEVGSNGPSDQTFTANAQLNSKTGRSNDEMVASAGVQAQAMLENFREFKSVITPAADALDKFTKKFVIWMDIIASASEADRPAMLKGMGADMQTAGGKGGSSVPVQKQGSKPKSR